ncbi:hypothetical protein SAMN02745223_01999 [Devosia limi DSM 17137]|uniref:Uncharacterized protein n=1 Tax=Devosia limi DSM 17137 TaxID=1121477 RepID=A0A1M4ZM29_9HYPH|nr:hypothetical protein SAMN02745223_01999 [Devosia limi DSM 17137]
MKAAGWRAPSRPLARPTPEVNIRQWAIRLRQPDISRKTTAFPHRHCPARPGNPSFRVKDWITRTSRVMTMVATSHPLPHARLHPSPPRCPRDWIRRPDATGKNPRPNPEGDDPGMGDMPATARHFPKKPPHSPHRHCPARPGNPSFRVKDWITRTSRVMTMVETSHPLPRARLHPHPPAAPGLDPGAILTPARA